MLSFKHDYWGWSEPLASLRSTQLAQYAYSGTAVHDLFTVPAGQRWIVKSVELHEVSGVASDVQLRTAAIGTWFRVHLAAYGSSGDHFQGFFWLVLEPGDKLQVNRITSGSLQVIVSGSVHTI